MFGGLLKGLLMAYRRSMNRSKPCTHAHTNAGINIRALLALWGRQAKH